MLQLQLFKLIFAPRSYLGQLYTASGNWYKQLILIGTNKRE